MDIGVKMMNKVKNKDIVFSSAILCVDNKDQEYLQYYSIVGPVRDYSPWLIKEYKEWRDNNG
jgi:hypothetical protein